MRKLHPIFTLLLAIALPALASAQERGFSAENFASAPGVGSFLTVEGATIPDGLGFRMGGLLDYEYEPLVIRRCDKSSGGTCTDWGGGEVALVKHKVMLEAMGALSLYRVFEVGLVVPVVLYQTGDSVRDAAGNTLVAGPSGNVGLDDLRLHLKLDILHGVFGVENQDVGLALVPVVTFPVGNAVQGGSFMGDSFITVQPKLAFNVTLGRVRLGANAGYLAREQKSFFMAEVGQRLTYGAAAEIGLADSLSGILEAFGQNGFTTELTGSPMEGDAAMRYAFANGLAATMGLGTGIIAGVGTPVVRVFCGVTWSPPPEPEPAPAPPPPPAPAPPPAPTDRDKDGLTDNVDQCPDEPEDRDGFEDEDGCPDPDNDKDGILDVNDKCPNDPETVNGFDDEDGCPDTAPLVELKEAKMEITENILFATDSDQIVGQRSFEILDSVHGVLTSNVSMHIRIEGNTDNRGGKQHNKDLSERRAKSVMRYLVGKGIDPDRLEAVGHGQDKPIVTNDTDEGRAANRRVDFVITKR
ncbi:MAG: OmpA family protein [Deltaproteobacteria bacterium]|nr:OmpA family protein [Deltaproteobacteria bacterium]